MALDTPAPQKPLRLWPGVALVVLQWLLWFVVPRLAQESALISVFGALGCGLAILLWWLFFSRAPWAERIGAIVLMVVAVVVTKRVVDPSIAGGMMGLMLPVFSIPALSLALVAGAMVGRRRSNGVRRTSMIGAIVLACGAFALLRTGGITGGATSDLHWRWTPTPEQRLLAQADRPLDTARDRPAAPAPAPVPTVAKTPETSGPDIADTKTGAEWPGFRGPARDDVVRGVRIETDWSQSKPVELWRQPIGPGWSSFAVHGNLIYTQEQRGDDEVVSCYNLTTGAPVWKHRDPVRFYESNGGPGPRGTPTLSHGRVYSLGATGLLNALDARDGSVVWSRDAATDTHAPLPGWGFSSSPAVVDDLVIVATSGALAAYDLATGKPRWIGPVRGGSYSSPQVVRIDGVAQVVLLSGPGARSVAPADGTLLWESAWPSMPIVQPAVLASGDMLITDNDAGTRRLAIAHDGTGWSAKERWTSKGLKPYFNDFVVHKDHAFGFDGSILACIDLEDGTRTWKGGRYGNGQLILLPDQDLLLVLSEEGELALVAATPDKFTELARFPAIEGKTWNHPVLAGDVLLVRNGEEMAAFRLSLARR